MSLDTARRGRAPRKRGRAVSERRKLAQDYLRQPRVIGAVRHPNHDQMLSRRTLIERQHKLLWSGRG
jgi:hypothetical protein